MIDMLHLQQIAVGGISMGAAVALNFALRYPQRVLGLVLVRPASLNAPLQFPELRPGSHTLKIRGTKVELFGALEA